MTYDQIDLKGWTQTDSTTIVRQPDSQLLEGLADAVDPARSHSFTFTVTPGGYQGPTILSPGTPVEVDETTRLTYVGHTGYFAMLERDGGSGSYTVTALTQPPVGAPGQLTQAELRVAGTAYPQEVKDLYLQVAPGSIGTERQEARGQGPCRGRLVGPIRSRQPDRDRAPFADVHLCHRRPRPRLRDLVHSGMLRDVQARVLPVLRGHDGGAPSRPGRADPDRRGVPAGYPRPNTGIETIQMSSAHTWVEVYFPGHGWVMFDPTGGNRSDVEPLRAVPS